ncbi:AGAP006514-PA [Anopheles gambiae str. PEST]|uniref:AGAP006514-PA n=1 Tax=Anopheles gambiae TaxID=7165 RepID=Q7Q5D0_ANOGA|nr:AGAP006514-PA [Anopheles gambiae str. PEST]
MRTVPKPTDKSKKTWGQRLKLSKASPVAEDKQSPGPTNGTASSNGSALIPFGARSYDPSLDYSGNGPASLSSVGHSNSSHTNVHQLATMKYAETWVYGTVRGMPPPLAMSPHHPHHAHLPAMYCPPPPPPEVAVLICCCPEYLTGTKREIKKASVCKKCKGSRLPLAPIGGTMRLTSGATYLAPPPIRTSAGTVKLASTYGKKSRPTILGNGNPDPYDFMRRSRLTQPAESGAGGPKSVKSSLKEKLRGRAKSTSPSRGRSGSTAGGKRSSAARSPSPSLSKNGSRVGGRKLESFQDCWVGEPDRDTDLLDDSPTSTAQNRKSILRCDVNPYDLISLSGIGGGSGGGSGGNNMLNEFAPDGDEFDLHSQKYENILDTLYANRYNPNPANSIAAINGQRIKLFDDSGTSVSGAPVYDDVDEFVYDPVEVPVEEAAATDELSSPSAGTPERPPRSKQRQLEATKENDDSRSLPSTAPSGTAEAGSPGVTPSAIKSILKRPSSMPAAPPSSMVTVEKDTGAGGPGYDTIRLNHTLVQRLAKLTTNANGSASEEGASTFGKHGTISARHLTDKRNSGSQFYLPTPFPVIASTSEPDATQSTTGGRKKVHFLVENEIIHDDDRLFAQMLFTEVVPGEVTPMPVKTTNGATERGAAAEESIGSRKDTPASSKQGGKARPKLPPPPPPPPTTTTQLPTGANGKAPASATPSPPGSNVYEDFCFGLMAGVRRSSSDRSSSTSTSSRTVVQVLASSSSFSSSSSSSPSSPSSCGSSPSPIASSGGIHRLEIRHDPEPEEEHYQKKTSILITGDDCYSTVNVDGASDTPIYQSSVVVNDGSVVASPTNEIRQTASNTITISVSSPTSTLESRGSKGRMATGKLAGDEQHANGTVVTMGREEVTTVSTGTSVIPIGGSSVTGSNGRTLINLDFGQPEQSVESSTAAQTDTKTSEDVTPIAPVPSDSNDSKDSPKVREDAAHDQQQQIVVQQASVDLTPTPVVLRRSLKPTTEPTTTVNSLQAKVCRNSFIAKLLEDPSLSQLSEGLDYELIAKLIESSLLRLKESRNGLDMSGTKDEDDVSKMIEQSLLKIQEERSKLTAPSNPASQSPQQNSGSKRSSVSSGNSYGSAAAYELMEFDQLGELSDCYQSCSSDLTVDDDAHSSRSKFYQMLVDATLSELEINAANEDDDDEHHYESIRLNGDPIYEEINDIPPPLPLTAPPIDDVDLEKQRNARSIFEGASKYDILSYLVDAKERGIVQEDGSYGFQFGGAGDIILEEEESEPITELRHHQRQISDISSRLSHLSGISDSSEDTSLSAGTLSNGRSSKASAEIERNDSGVGSETSKTSRSRWQNPISTTTTSTTTSSLLTKITPIHLCEDCDGPVETQVTESGVMYAPLVCRKCGKKRAERKEIITEIVETEEKYGRDLQIILEEFYQPMLVAGLLNQEQLSAIFLNVEELLENNQFLAERMRDALDIANEQGDDDLLTVSIGKIFLEAAPMLHAFENYCVRQGAASLLLANLEKEKELLRIFLRVSQMENAVLRRMNLNSFLMVPVQRVTKYPLLLARLYKVTPAHLEGKELLKQSQEKIELHLNHMNREAKDVPTKLWRRISSSSPGRRLSCELDMINIKLRKMAVDVLEWNHEEVRFAIEGRLLFTQPNDGNWKKSRTIKLTSINALLVTNGKPTASYKADRALSETLSFPRHTGIREASLLLVREKGGRLRTVRRPNSGTPSCSTIRRAWAPGVSVEMRSPTS